MDETSVYFHRFLRAVLTQAAALEDKRAVINRDLRDVRGTVRIVSRMLAAMEKGARAGGDASVTEEPGDGLRQRERKSQVKSSNGWREQLCAAASAVAAAGVSKAEAVRDFARAYALAKGGAK